MTLLRDITGRLTRAQALAGVALVSVAVLASVYWNVASLIVLQDHPLPWLVFWPSIWLLLGTAVTLLTPSGQRSRTAAAVSFAATAMVVLFSAGIVLAVGVLSDSSGSGELVDSANSVDGRYQVRVLHWQAMLGEDGWNVVVQRRDGLRTKDGYAGCLFAENSGAFEQIQSVEAGSVQIATEQGPISITFDPESMVVTKRIPMELCQGYD
jgi:hypothetical protein